MLTTGRVHDFTAPGVYRDFLRHNQAIVPRLQHYLNARDRELVVMPDLREDLALPTGTCLFTSDRIYPLAIGTDPGCGYGLWRLPGAAASLDADLTQHLTRHALQPPTAEETTFVADQLSAPPSLRDLFLAGAGRLAPGNHYIELHRPVEHGTLATPDDLLLVVHNGSLEAGYKLQVHALRLAGVTPSSAEEQLPYATLQRGTPPFDRYLELHAVALEFAALNRTLLAQRIARLAGTRALQPISDIVHSGVATTATGYAHLSGTQLLTDQPAAFIGIATMERGFLALPNDHLHASRHVIPHGVGPTPRPHQPERHTIASNLSRAELEGIRASWRDHLTSINLLQDAQLITVDTQTDPMVILKTRRPTDPTPT